MENESDNSIEIDALKKGRIVITLSNIKLFKDNPYLNNLTDAEKIKANLKLIAPCEGELFYDDDHFIWMCYDVDAEKSTEVAQGAIKYKYISKERENYDHFNISNKIKKLFSCIYIKIVNILKHKNK
jgi:hypothetical protein